MKQNTYVFKFDHHYYIQEYITSPLINAHKLAYSTF